MSSLEDLSKFRHRLEKSFDHYSKEELEQFKKDNGILALKRLPDGFWVGVKPLMYTVAICAGIEPFLTYRYRWCFEDPQEAVKFWKEIKCYDDLPTSKESLKGHRYHNTPKYLAFDRLNLPRW